MSNDSLRRVLQIKIDSLNRRVQEGKSDIDDFRKRIQLERELEIESIRIDIRSDYEILGNLDQKLERLQYAEQIKSFYQDLMGLLDPMQVETFGNAKTALQELLGGKSPQRTFLTAFTSHLQSVTTAVQTVAGSPAGEMANRLPGIGSALSVVRAVAEMATPLLQKAANGTDKMTRAIKTMRDITCTLEHAQLLHGDLYALNGQQDSLRVEMERTRTAVRSTRFSLLEYPSQSARPEVRFPRDDKAYARLDTLLSGIGSLAPEAFRRKHTAYDSLHMASEHAMARYHAVAARHHAYWVEMEALLKRRKATKCVESAALDQRYAATLQRVQELVETSRRDGLIERPRDGWEYDYREAVSRYVFRF